MKTHRVHPSGWDVIGLGGDDGTIVEQHVIPVHDLRPHIETPQCWCQPTEDDEQPNLWAHNALDRREQYEEGRRLS